MRTNLLTLALFTKMTTSHRPGGDALGRGKPCGCSKMLYLIWIMFLMGHGVKNATATINCTEILANMKTTTNTMTDGTTESPASTTMVSVETSVTDASTQSPVSSTMMTETTNNSTMEEATTQSPDSGTTMDLIAYCLMTTTNTDTTTMMSDSSPITTMQDPTTTISEITTTPSTAELLILLNLDGGGPFSSVSQEFITYLTKIFREFLQSHCDISSNKCCSPSQSAMVSLNFKGGVVVLRDIAVLYGFRFSFSLDCTASASRRAVNQVAPGTGFGIDLTAVKNLISQNLKKLNDDLSSCCAKNTVAECCEATVKSAEAADSTQAIATVPPPISKEAKLSNVILIAILASIGCIFIATLIVTMIGLSKRNKRINQTFMRPPMPGLMPGPGPPAAFMRPQPRPYGPMMPRIWPVNQPRPYQFPPMSKHWSNHPRRMF